MLTYVTLYYDDYEAKNGDGFYPLTYNNASCDTEIEIGFEFINGTWMQATGPHIHGWDGNEYSKVMKLLNEQYKKNNLCINK